MIAPESMELESVGVDCLDYAGKATIGINLFTPYRLGSPAAFDTMQRIIEEAVTPAVKLVFHLSKRTRRRSAIGLKRCLPLMLI